MSERYAEPGRALHAEVTCCDDLWPELDLESQAQWAEEERRILDRAALVPNETESLPVYRNDIVVAHALGATVNRLARLGYRLVGNPVHLVSPALTEEPRFLVTMGRELSGLGVAHD